MLKKLTGLVGLFLIFLFFVSCNGGGGTNPTIPGVKGPFVNIFEDRILISSVLPGLPLDGGARYSIPGGHDSYIEISPDLGSSGTLMAISLSLKDIDDEFGGELVTMGLPGGRPLPEVPGGRMQALNFSVQNISQMVLYISDEKVGLYFPVLFAIADLIYGFDYFVGDQKAGKLFIIGQDAAKVHSGFLLMLDVNEQKKKLIRKFAPKYIE